MDVTRSDQQGVVIVRVRGHVDSTTSGQLQAVVLPAVAEGSHRLVMDFTRVDYVSSAGLRVVLMAAKQARAEGGEIAIFGLNNPVRETFEISGFASIIALADSEDGAMRAVRGPESEDGPGASGGG